MEPVDFSDINHTLGSTPTGPSFLNRGLKDFSLLEPRERLSALQRAAIERIGQDINEFRRSHPRTYALSTLEPDSLFLYTHLHQPFSEVQPEALTLRPISWNEYGQLLETCHTLDHIHEVIAVLRPRTEAVLSYHVVAYEREQLRRPESEREALYQNYVKALAELKPKLFEREKQEGNDYLLSADLLAGFQFGQSVFWRLAAVAPLVLATNRDEDFSLKNMRELALAALPVAKTLARMSMLGVHTTIGAMSASTQVFNPNFMSCIRTASGLKLEVKEDVVAERAMRTLRSEDQQDWHHNLKKANDAVLFSEIATGCPALYTPFFSNVHKWIVDVAEQFVFPWMEEKYGYIRDLHRD